MTTSGARRAIGALAVVVLAGGATVLYFGLGSRKNTADAAPADAHAALQRVVAQAQIVPIDGIIEVRPLAEGRVLRVLVQPGDHVAVGQLLAEIESDLESAAVKQRKADLGSASARLSLTGEGVRPEERAALADAADAARLDADSARDRWERQQRLRQQGFVSDQSVVEAERAWQAASARAQEARERAEAASAGGRAAEVDAARHAVVSADAALSQGQVALSRTRIVAPVGGIVMARNVNPGDIIGSNVTSPTLFRIVDPARVEVRFEVEESLAPYVVPGLAVELRLPGRDTVVGRGKVTRMAPQVEKRSIGADDAKIRADSMVRPAWSDFTPEPGVAPLPVNFRLEAWVRLPAPQR
ncbi:MAG TPA: efflux RND transporter periplasmic adaptor subunit [Burkholderiaceae bacterium]|nr:efflux RND transporter periplasmic adaptor subunit [Burkholderiaceae bacterium]